MKQKILTRLLRTGLFSLVLTFLIGAGTTFAADLYWVGGCSGNNWNDTFCWATSSGGMGGMGVWQPPTLSDDVHFTGDVNDNCEIINGGDYNNGEANSITIDSDYTGTITQGDDITLYVRTDFTMYGGTFLGPNGTTGATDDGYVSTGGSLNIDGGTFTGRAQDLYVNSNFNFDSGTFTAPGTYMSVFGDWDQEAGTIFYHNNGYVAFEDWDEDINITISNPTEYRFNDIKIIKKTGTTTQLTSDIKLDGSFYAYNGTLIDGTGDIYLKGDWNVDPDGTGSTTFIYQAENTVYFDGNDQSIIGSTTFNNISKSGSDTLFFEPADTSRTTITGTWSALGTSLANPLVLKSTVDESQWYVDLQGDEYFTFLDVRDSYAVSEIDARGTGSIANASFPLSNYNWLFGEGASTIVPQISPNNETSTSPTFRWSDISGETTYTIEVRNRADTDWNSPVLTMTSAADTTYKTATSELSTGLYTWRIYADNSTPSEATTMNFSTVNLVPEFNTYLYLLMFILGGFFIYKQQRQATEIN